MEEFYTIKDDNYFKFPSVIREKMQKGECVFLEHTCFEHEPFVAFRGIERCADDCSVVSRKDFKSHAERKLRRRMINRNDPHYFGVSLFLNKESVENALSFARPNKKIAMGSVYSEAGSAEINDATGHVCWWLYDGIEIEGFTICER